MVHIRNQTRNTSHPTNPPFPVQPTPSVSEGSGFTKGPWEAEADRICAAMVKRAPDVLRKASEALYEQMLYDVQDYLRDNTGFNLSSELASAKHRADQAEAKAAKLATALDGARQVMRNAWGAVSSDQVVDKQVDRMLRKGIEDAAAALSLASGSNPHV